MAYIRLPKELLSSEMWMYELNNDTKIFFIHLLSKATHKRCRATFLGEIFELEAGEVVITQRKLANTLNISENNVRKHISTLISKELITTKVTQSVRGGYAENFKNRRTVITISNTDNYTGATDPIGATSESDDEQNIYAFYRKEEIKEFNNKKKGAQKELFQEVDLV
ncbi:MAG: winged helix-turn-helix domain-containing protein, partial [Bacteroidales bacterium]